MRHFIRAGTWAGVGLLAVLPSVLGAAPLGSGGTAPSAATGKTLLATESLFGPKAVQPEGRPGSQWYGDDGSYTLLEAAPGQPDARDIVRYAAGSGKRTVLVAATHMVPPGTTRPLVPTDYAWSADRQWLLLFVQAASARRNNPVGAYWVLNLKNGGLRRLGGAADADEALLYAEFAPDGRHVAYVRSGDLYVEPTDGGPIARLTEDGSRDILNGRSDGAYEEEFALGRAFAWSPDSRRIAYWRFDTSAEGRFAMVSNTAGAYSRVQTQIYPKVGTPVASVRVGTVSAAGGATRWFALADDPQGGYVPRMSWAGGSDAVLIQQLNRRQNRNSVLIGTVADGAVRPLFVEEDAAWVDINDRPFWLDDGRAFTWLSERDGWRHLYVVDRATGRLTLRTPGAYDVVSVENVDPASGQASFIASPGQPTQRYLYRATLSGPPQARRLTPQAQPGTHDYSIAPSGAWAFHTYSRFDTPPVTDLVHLPDHRSVRPIVRNVALRRFVDGIAREPAEFFQVDAGDGTLLDGWMLRPPGFDPSRRYPLLVYVYSEPAGQTVADRWGGSRYLWHLMLAQQGYLVASIDSRGAAAPRGRAWRKSIYRQIGLLASADQAAAVRGLLAARPYIDPARIGIWGWSGGGAMTLNALFRYPDLYAAGIAVAAPTDQRLYDAIYQERYMGLPEDNPEGYFKGSPINFADRLKGRLLLVHGTGDDNVHYQHLEQLEDRLIAANRPFSMMAYPDRTHSLSEKPGTQLHLYSLMTDYLHANLPAGARP